MGCIIGTQTDVIGSNVLVIPQYEAIVIGRNGKYTIINSLGEEYVPLILDSVFSQRVSGEDKYYMTYTWPLDENGEATEESETFTYDVDQYFELYIVPQDPDMNVGDTNTMTNTEITDTNLVIDQNIVTNVAIDSNVTTETNTVSSN